MTSGGGITIIIPGDPVAKGRPRFANRGKFAQVYTDKKTRAYEKRIRIRAEMLMRDDRLERLNGPLFSVIMAYRGVPKSWPKYKRQNALNGTLFAMSKPDLDNYTKVVDGLNGVVFEDDSRIIGTLGFKTFSREPRLEITLAPMVFGVVSEAIFGALDVMFPVENRSLGVKE